MPGRPTSQPNSRLDSEPPSSTSTSPQFQPYIHLQQPHPQLPTAPLTLAVSFALGCATTFSLVRLHARYAQRIRNGDWITPDVFARRRWVRGVVTSVGDADNFRLYHTPALGLASFRRVPATSKALKDQTLHIRIAGIDAPEGAHFGRPAQPYAAESLAWLRHAVLGRTLYCQLLRRDQYSRVVANVLLPPRILPGALASGKSLALEMLHAGWVTTYEQAGAEYGQWGKDAFLKAEAEAKVARRGMWKHGTDAETPAEYKRRYANSQAGRATEEQRRNEGAQGRGWVRRLLRF